MALQGASESHMELARCSKYHVARYTRAATCILAVAVPLHALLKLCALAGTALLTARLPPGSAAGTARRQVAARQEPA